MLESAKPWVGMIIADTLQKIESSLDILHDDRMLLDICQADFWEYATWIEKNFINVEKDELTYIDDGTLSCLVEQNDGDIKKNVEFVEMFVKLWWKKYKQRIKLSFDLPPQDLMIAKGEGVLRQLFTPEEKAEIIETLTQTFIRWGEICMSKKLAESIFIRSLGQMTLTKISTQDKINLLTTLQREAKRISYTHGHLLFIRPNRFMLREFRDDRPSQS